MGNFEKLSVLVIVVIIVMILVVALYTWTGDPSGGGDAVASVATNTSNEVNRIGDVQFPPKPDKPVVNKDPKDDPKRSGPTRLSAEELMKAMLAESNGMGVPGPSSGKSEPGVDPVVGGGEEPKPVVAKEPKLHVVAPGETVGKIAKAEYPGVGQRAIDAILKANPTVDPSRMAVGTKLLLPELASASDPKVAIETPRKGPAPSDVVATIKPGTIYVTKKGDTLPALAKRAYRDSNQWHRIWVENFDAIQDPEHIAGGMRLRIPVL